MKTYYRIVTDRWAGFEVQSWSWWWPFWSQVGFSNTHSYVEDAEAYAQRHARGCANLVKYLGPLP